MSAISLRARPARAKACAESPRLKSMLRQAGLNKDPRAHHIVPRFYLEGFSREGSPPILWVHQKGRPPRPSTPRNEANYRDFYAFQKGKIINYDFEYTLSSFETEAAAILKNLRENGYNFSRDDREIMSFFVSLMFTRVPAFRTYIRKKYDDVLTRLCHADEASKLAEEASQRLQKHISPEMIQAQLKSENFRLKKHDINYISWTIEWARKIVPMLSSMNWRILQSEGEDFITCDNPVVTRRDDKSSGRVIIGDGFRRHGVYIYFPVNHTACLVMSNESFEIIPGNLTVRDINRSLMLVTTRCVYAVRKSDNLDRLFQEIGCSVEYGRNAFL